MKFPFKIYVEDHFTHKCPWLQECTDFIANKDSGQTPAVLQNPFPNQQQQHQHMVDNPPKPHQQGKVVHILPAKDHLPFMALRVLNFKHEPSFMEILP